MTAAQSSLATSLALLALACGGSSGGTGKVTVLLKDAPALEVRAAVVTLDRIALQGDGGEVVLSETPATKDLLTLAHDVATIVNGADVPAGTYTQLRLVISGGYLDVGGTLYATANYPLPVGAVRGGALRMPSYGQSGLKVDLAQPLVVGTAAHVLVVDFDVAGSFGHEAGGSGAWVMHPVVKGGEAKLTGTLEVTLALAPGATLPDGVALADFSALVAPAAGGDAVPVALLDLGGGVFGASYPYLFPGDYAVGFGAPDAVSAFTTDPVTPKTFTVASGQATAADFLLGDVTGTVPERPL